MFSLIWYLFKFSFCNCFQNNTFYSSKIGIDLKFFNNYLQYLNYYFEFISHHNLRIKLTLFTEIQYFFSKIYVFPVTMRPRYFQKLASYSFLFLTLKYFCIPVIFILVRLFKYLCAIFLYVWFYIVPWEILMMHLFDISILYCKYNAKSP